MPLSNINLMESAGFGHKVTSDGVEYTVIFHLGGNVALACRSTDKFPAQLYAVRFDVKKKEEDPGPNDGQKQQEQDPPQ